MAINEWLPKDEFWGYARNTNKYEYWVESTHKHLGIDASVQELAELRGAKEILLKRIRDADTELSIHREKNEQLRQSYWDERTQRILAEKKLKAYEEIIQQLTDDCSGLDEAIERISKASEKKSSAFQVTVNDQSIYITGPPPSPATTFAQFTSANLTSDPSWWRINGA